MELVIRENHVKEFRLIIEVYQRLTTLPERHNWQWLSEDALWKTLIGQVLVVGSAASKQRFEARADLQHFISLRELGRLKREESLKKRLHYTLRAVGSRYAAKELQSCKKTHALFENYMFLKQQRQGFKTVLRRLERIGGKERELRRVAYLMEHFQFFSSKSARDLLMTLGVNEQTIAIDIRIQNVFQCLRIAFPSTEQLGKPEIYDDTERQILEKICRPLDVVPLRFDRTLFQHYRRILRKDYYQLKLDFY